MHLLTASRCSFKHRETLLPNGYRNTSHYSFSNTSTSTRVQKERRDRGVKPGTQAGQLDAVWVNNEKYPCTI